MLVALMLLMVFLGLAGELSAAVRPKAGALPNTGAASLAGNSDVVIESPAQRPARSSGWGGSIGAMERNVRISLGREREQRIAGSMRAARKVVGAGIAARAPSAPDATDPGLPTRIWFGPPSPNPSQGRVSFRLDLPATGRVGLSVLDVAGRVVHEIDETKEAGRHVLEWDGQDRNGRTLPAGVYFARLFVDGIPGGRQRVVFLH